MRATVSGAVKPKMPKTSSSAIFSPQNATSWSSMDSASRRPPSAPRAMASAPSAVSSIFLVRADLLQMRRDERGGDAPQVKALGSGERMVGSTFCGFGRREDEFDVLGRLLQRLEQAR